MADPSADVFLPEIVARIAAVLPRNDIACNLRPVCRATAEQFRGRAPIALSQPVPHAVFSAHWSVPGACRGLSLAQRRKLVYLTAASGDLVNLKVALAASGCTGERLAVEACDAAGAAGQLEPCRWFLEQGRMTVKGLGRLEFMCKVARGGHREIYEWALGAGVKWCEYGPQCAAEGGHWELLDWLLSVRPADAPQPHWSQIVIGAAASCDLATLEKIWAEYGKKVGRYDRAKCVGAALGSPGSDWQAKAEFLEGQGCALEGWTELPRLPEDSAAARLAWVKSRGAKLHPHDAAAIGDLAQVRHLLSEGQHAAEKLGQSAALGRAALKGHLEVLKLVASKCDIGPAVCALKAASGGQLAVLEWLLEPFGAEGLGGWRPELGKEAAFSANVELMQWLREHGCPYGPDAWIEAADSGCEAALELLASWDIPHPADGQPYSIAAQNGDLRTLRVLRRLGLSFHTATTFSDAVWQAMRGGGSPLEALQWLHAEGCPVDWTEANERAEGGRVFNKQPVRDWIKDHVNQEHTRQLMLSLGVDPVVLEGAMRALRERGGLGAE